MVWMPAAYATTPIEFLCIDLWNFAILRVWPLWDSAEGEFWKIRISKFLWHQDLVSNCNLWKFYGLWFCSCRLITGRVAFVEIDSPHWSADWFPSKVLLSTFFKLGKRYARFRKKRHMSALCHPAPRRVPLRPRGRLDSAGTTLGRYLWCQPSRFTNRVSKF